MPDVTRHGMPPPNAGPPLTCRRSSTTSCRKCIRSVACRTLQWQVEETIDAPLDRTWAAIEDLSLIRDLAAVLFPGDLRPGIEGVNLEV
jgi:hypothetical protein